MMWWKRLLCACCALGLLSIGGWALAQEAADETAAEQTEQAQADDEADDGDDIFVPSENIEADSEISFPADI